MDTLVHDVGGDGVQCEGCGYALDGLGRDEVCSECGLAVASSLPRARAGTPWQQRAGLGSLLGTWWLLLTDDDCWREMRIDRASRRAFVGWARVLGYSVLLLAGIWYTLADSGSSLTLFVFVLLLPVLASEIVLASYRVLMAWRLRVGSKLRDECQEQAAHEQVLDHASVGIMVLPIGLAVGLACVSVGMHIEGATGSSLALRAGFFVGVGFAVLGLLGGLLLFELSGRRGWRAMRYRRLVGNESEQVKIDVFASRIDDAGVVGELLDHWTLRRGGQGLLSRKIDLLSVLLLRVVVTPALFLVLWLVNGFGPGRAAVISVLALIGLSIVQRVLMVPVRVIWG
ncbi:MAG: hypothetical protein ACF8K1_04550 [Phycisphaerales bacterium JB047]